MKIKKICKLILSLSVILAVLSGCTKSSSETESVIKVGATPVPHGEILQFCKPLLEKKGYTLDIIEFNDYIQPNLALKDGTIHANFFQHTPYMESFAKDHKLNLASAGAVHIEPLGIYSKKISDLKNLRKDSKVSLPNDVTNHARALMLLHKAGLIELKDPENLKAHYKTDIAENPLDLQFSELESPMLARTLDDVDISVINTNFALESGLNPVEDSLFIEGSDSPYANIVCVLESVQDSDKTKALMDVLSSKEVSDFILEKYEGSILPADK